MRKALFWLGVVLALLGAEYMYSKSRSVTAFLMGDYLSYKLSGYELLERNKICDREAPKVYKVVGSELLYLAKNRNNKYAKADLFSHLIVPYLIEDNYACRYTSPEERKEIAKGIFYYVVEMWNLIGKKKDPESFYEYDDIDIFKIANLANFDNIDWIDKTNSESIETFAHFIRLNYLLNYSSWITLYDFYRLSPLKHRDYFGGIRVVSIKGLFEDTVKWCNGFAVEEAKKCIDTLAYYLYKEVGIREETWFKEFYRSLNRKDEDYLFKREMLDDSYKSIKPKRIRIMESLALAKNPRALVFIGDAYQYGYYGFPKDIFMAEKQYLLASKTPYGELSLYKMYSHPDYRYLFNKSDKELAKYLSSGIIAYGIMKDIRRGLYYDTELHKLQWELADLYFKTKDYRNAKYEYEQFFRYNKSGESAIRAAERLGDIYYQGLGLRQDLAKAKEYYGIACDYKAQSACDKYREVNEKMR